MRKAINENPKVQIGLLVGLAVLVLMFVAGPLKPKDKAAAPATTAGAAGTPAAAPPAAGTAPPAGAVSAPVGAPTAAPGPTSVPPEALIPGPGLPAPVARAWARGDAIALLIVKPGSRDDDLVRASLGAIQSRGDVSTFVAPAREIARYSRITQGVGVTRVPALVVVRPRGVSGATPQGTVSYGFRDAASIIQAVNDALYDGREDVPYHPG